MIDYISEYFIKNYDVSIDKKEFFDNVNVDYIPGIYNLYKKNSSIEAMRRKNYWIDNKEKYLIICIQLSDKLEHGYNIAVGDLNGNIIMNTKFTVDIITETIGIVTWKDVWEELQILLKGKILLAYNAESVVNNIYNFCDNFKLQYTELYYECIMYNAMDIIGIEKPISLEDFTLYERKSYETVVDECLACIDLIKSDKMKIYKGA